MLRTLFKSLAMVGLISSPAAVAAASLLPGDMFSMPATAIAADPGLDGTVIYDETQTEYIFPFGNNLFAFGYGLQTQVVESADDGNLIFRYRLFGSFNNTGVNSHINRLAIFDQGNFDLDVTLVTDLDMTGDGMIDGARGPTSVSRGVVATRVDYTFGFPLINGTLTSQPQESTYAISHRTNANGFATDGVFTALGSFMTATGQESFSVTFRDVARPLMVPVAPVPLPASGMVLLAGLALLGMSRRKPSDT